MKLVFENRIGSDISEISFDFYEDVISIETKQHDGQIIEHAQEFDISYDDFDSLIEYYNTFIKRQINHKTFDANE